MAQTLLAGSGCQRKGGRQTLVNQGGDYIYATSGREDSGDKEFLMVRRFVSDFP